MKTRLMSITLLVAILALAFGSVAPAYARPAAQLSLPVTGTFTDAVGGTGTFEGTFDLQRFVYRSGALMAVGTLTGTLTDSLGVVQNVSQTVTIPVTNITGSCDILHLELGPVDLDLLGLVVHLDQIVLDIDAESGPGNLLGNLLCAVAGLLDSQGSLSAVARLLNQILNILG